MSQNTGAHTCNAFLGPMLQADSVILPIINFFNGCPSVEKTLIIARDRLREMPQPVPLATLFCESRPSINMLSFVFPPFFTLPGGHSTYEDSW